MVGSPFERAVPLARPASLRFRRLTRFRAFFGPAGPIGTRLAVGEVSSIRTEAPDEMNQPNGIRAPARILLWLGGVICGLAVRNPAPWSLTVAFLATLAALLALQHLDEDE